MRISIVIATFNAARCLEKCLDSCIEQTWPDKEVIVIDGGSSDRTLDIIRGRQDHIAFWVSEPDLGVYDAWNKALQHITGDWVLFRGADDIFWDANVLENALPLLAAATPTELICYGAAIVGDENGQFLYISGSSQRSVRDEMAKQMSIPHPATFHRRELFDRFGAFDTSYRIAGDYELLLRVLRRDGVDAKFMPGLIITMMQSGGLSHRRGWLTRRESIAALKKNGYQQTPWTQYTQLVRYLICSTIKVVFHFLLGEAWTELNTWRRRRASRRLQGEIDAIVTGTAAGSLKIVPRRSLACQP